MGKPSRSQPIRIDYQLVLHGLAEPVEPRSSVVARGVVLLLSVLTVLGGLTLPAKGLNVRSSPQPTAALFDPELSISPAASTPILISKEQALGQSRIR